MAQNGKRIEAQRETMKLVEGFDEITLEQELKDIEVQAADLRRSYGEWSVRRYFEQLGLLEVAITKAAALPHLAVKLMCFVIDNHNDEDEVRMIFQRRFHSIFEDVFIPRRRLGNRELQTHDNELVLACQSPVILTDARGRQVAPGWPSDI